MGLSVCSAYMLLSICSSLVGNENCLLLCIIFLPSPSHHSVARPQHSTAQHTTNSHWLTHSLAISFSKISFIFLFKFCSQSLCVYTRVYYVYSYTSIGIILFLIVHGDGCTYGWRVCVLFCVWRPSTLVTNAPARKHTYVMCVMCMFCNIRDM